MSVGVVVEVGVVVGEEGIYVDTRTRYRVTDVCRGRGRGRGRGRRRGNIGR